MEPKFQLALPDHRRRPVDKPVVRPADVQPQLAAAVPSAKTRNERPAPLELEPVSREVRSRSTVEPRELPPRELDQRREDLTGSDVGPTPEGVRTLTLAMFGIEGQPSGFHVLTLVRREAQVPLVSLDTLPAVPGVAHGGIDLVP